MPKLLMSESNNPAINLAIEEYLIENNESVIYLWINAPTIVIGRNQNPYTECNISKIKEDGVFLMRRKSGGGAVYHDLGNLNFTIISKKTPEAIDENFSLVCRVLKNLDINAKVSGRNDLEVDGLKISGSAFYETDNMYLHHGTLLVDVDLNKLSNYLTANPLKLKSKGIKSVKGRVINLHDLNPNINTKRVINEFSLALNQKINLITYGDIKDNPRILEKINHYNSFEWIYGESMKYDLKLTNKFSWGLIEIDLEIDSGLIKNAIVYTDSVIMEDFKSLGEALKGKIFKLEDLIGPIEETINNKNIRADIISLFNIS